jgi:hypothetical protein
VDKEFICSYALKILPRISNGYDVAAYRLVLNFNKRSFQVYRPWMKASHYVVANEVTTSCGMSKGSEVRLPESLNIYDQEDFENLDHDEKLPLTHTKRYGRRQRSACP